METSDMSSSNAQQAQEANARYLRAADEIRADPNLSDEGKRQQIATHFAVAYREVERLRQAESAAHGKADDRLTREVFGVDEMRAPGVDSTALTVAYRDAQDRAAQIEHADEAMAVMQRADSSGDRTLARAIAARAVDLVLSDPTGLRGGQGWANVANAHGERHPSWEMAVQRYQQEQANRPGLFDFLPPVVPREMAGMWPEQIAQLGEAG